MAPQLFPKGLLYWAPIIAIWTTTPNRAEGGISISLSNVPTHLTLPPYWSENHIITAKIVGDPAESVWLARINEDASRSESVPLTKSSENEFSINLCGSDVLKLVEPYGPEGTLRVYARTASGETAESVVINYTLNARPRRLDVQNEGSQFNVIQRDSQSLPGSNGRLQIWLGDISGGSVKVTVRGNNWGDVVETQTMREGDVLQLSLADETYTLVLDKLVNVFIGKDHAEFTILPTLNWKAARVEQLLQAIATAEVTFIRNDQPLTGHEFALLLRAKMEEKGNPKMSVEEFIQEIAGRSSTTGKPYLVKPKDGDPIEAVVWLTQKAAQLSRTQRRPDSESTAKE